VAVVETMTLVAPFAGVSAVTVGGGGAMVNDHENGALMGVPELFSAPLIVAV
jgi:hypothetical protein